MVRVFRHYIPKSLVVLGSGEAALLFCSVYLGASFRISDFNPAEKLMVGELWPSAVLYASLMMLVMAAMGLYQRQLRDDIRGVVFRVSLAFVVGLALMTAALWLLPSLRFGGTGMVVTAIFSALGIILLRLVLFSYRQGDLFRRKVLVVGAGRMASQAESLRRKTDRRDMELVGYLPQSEPAPLVPEVKRLPESDSVTDVVSRLGVTDIVVGLDGPLPTELVGELFDCKMNGVRVIEMLTFMEEQTGKIQLDAVDPSRFVFSEGFIQVVLKGYLHRAMDILLSSVGLLILWPLMALTALAILIESGFCEPVLYRQVRVGREGKHFLILKFRSMRPDAEDGVARYAVANDSRVTRVGAVIRKLRIDELPQLFNVFRGEMSFVGPRPERPEFVEHLRKTIPYYDLRSKVNPGITGWAQISYPYGSSDMDTREKLQYDLYYLKNYSLFLDLTILIQTAQVVLWGKGAR